MCEKTMDQLTKAMEEKLKHLSESIERAADKGAEEIKNPENENNLSCTME